MVWFFARHNHDSSRYISLFLLLALSITWQASCDFGQAHSIGEFDFPKTQQLGLDQEVTYLMESKANQHASIPYIRQCTITPDWPGFGLRERGQTVGSDDDRNSHDRDRVTVYDGGYKGSSRNIYKGGVIPSVNRIQPNDQTTFPTQSARGNPSQSSSGEDHTLTTIGLTVDGEISSTSDAEPSPQAWGAPLGFILATTVILLGAD